MLVVAKATLFFPLSLEPGCFHTWRAPNNVQIYKNSHEVHFGEHHPCSFGRTLNIHIHPSVMEPAVSLNFCLVLETLSSGYSHSPMIGMKVAKVYFVIEVLHQLILLG